jgi:hypothetical protein
VSGWAWSIVDTGGAISGITGSGSLVTVNAIGVGTAVVELTTASGSGHSTTRLSITVAAKPTDPPPANPGDPGGGAVSAAWLALLALATLALALARRRSDS